MKFTLSDKTILISILFVISFLITCKAANISTATPGNIKGINSEIILTGNQLHLSNKLTLQEDDVIRFYLPLYHFLSNLEISNAQGEKIEYNLTKAKNGVMIEIEAGAETQNITVDYDMDLRKLKPSISFQQDKNQLFLLPETSVFPTNYINFTPDIIEYAVTASDAEGKYSYAKQTALGNAFCPPALIFGNFRIVESDGVKVYIPDGIHVNKEALDYAVSCISSAFNYFTAAFGKNELSDDIKLFFLNRRGGYALEDGIILNQEYISENNIKRKGLASVISHEIAHEIAHLWWGRGVKPTSTVMSEGLAELSTYLYLIENEQQNAKDIYSDKNIKVFASNLKPEDFRNVDLSNANYRTIAYNKLPIILHEAELKIGRDNLKKALSSFYMAEKNSPNLSGFEEMISHFPATCQTELRQDVDGTLANWPDYSIKNVSGNTVIFQGHNICFPEIVPVTLTTDQNQIISDTLRFDVTTTEITRQYEDAIVKIIVDSDFATNQSELLNDLWTKDSGSFLDNKWHQQYPPQYYTFFNSLLNYLFTPSTEGVDDIADKKLQSTLSAAKEKLMTMSLCNTFIHLRKSDQSFKIYLTINSGKRFVNGYIEGELYEKDGIVYLKSINSIKI